MVLKFKLEEDFTYFIPNVYWATFNAQYLGIHSTSKGTYITIPKGYSWNGCTPKISVLDLFILGTPDGRLHQGKPITYYASLVHDAIYQYKAEHNISRWDADLLFLTMLTEVDFGPRNLYYKVVRRFGHKYGEWNNTQCADPVNKNNI